LSKFHRGHSSRHIEVSGELEDASMKIKCKVLDAIFTPAAALNPPKNDIQGLLKLVDKDGEILECMSSKQSAMPEVEFHMDDDSEFIGPQQGYVVVLQHCVHEGNCRLSDDIEGSDDEEYDALDALFLQMRDKVKERFERMGLIRFKGSQAVSKVLKAHHRTEGRAITLI
jgi:hypothetical protein